MAILVGLTLLALLFLLDLALTGVLLIGEGELTYR